LELSLPLAPRSQAPPKPPVAMTLAEMETYAGTYVNGALKIELYVRDGKLLRREHYPTTVETGPGHDFETAVTKVGTNRFAFTPPGEMTAAEFILIPGPGGGPEYLHSFMGAARRIEPAQGAIAQTSQPFADYLFIGSYHMDNPGRDAHNTAADDVLSQKRQREIDAVVRLIERYRPTKVMVEVNTTRQADISKRFADSCAGSRPFSRSEVEQLGFRIACHMGLETVYAVDWNELGPFKDEDSVDYVKAVERNHQQKQYDEHMAIGKAESERGQQILDHGTVLTMLRHLNSNEWLAQNAKAYYRIGILGTQLDPIGANWVQLWFGRNLTIFNNIARHAGKNDRILVIYGAGHGNYLRQLATDSGIFRVHDPMRWLSAEPGVQ
jgi:hypothetical protein